MTTAIGDPCSPLARLKFATGDELASESFRHSEPTPLPLYNSATFNRILHSFTLLSRGEAEQIDRDFTTPLSLSALSLQHRPAFPWVDTALEITRSTSEVGLPFPSQYPLRAKLLKHKTGAGATPTTHLVDSALGVKVLTLN